MLPLLLASHASRPVAVNKEQTRLRPNRGECPLRVAGAGSPQLASVGHKSLMRSYPVPLSCTWTNPHAALAHLLCDERR